MAKGNTVTKSEENNLMVISDTLPAHLAGRTGPARGMEEVGANDLIIPRLEIIQSLSPARDKTSASYIEGAEEGQIFNNVTREIIGTEALVVPVVFKKQYLVWKDRKKGGGTNGYRGAFDTEALARQRIAELNAEGESDLDVVDTAQHFCLVLRGNSVEEAVVSMSKSKQKVSKRWNSLMRMVGGDSFSRVYKLSTIVETNARNEKYHNFNVAAVGYAPEVVYRKAEALYEQIHSGGVVIDQNFEGEGESHNNQDEF